MESSTSHSDLPSIPDQTPHSIEYNDYLRHLNEDSERLFSDSEVAVEVLCCNEDTGGQRVTTSLINSEVSLEAALESSRHASDVFFILWQEDTYSSLDLTMDIFLRLFKFCDSSHSFLDFVHGFGYKSSGVDENSNYHYCQSKSPKSYGLLLLAHLMISSAGLMEGNLAEFSYNIRYMAKNGRRTGSPWSTRHTAVCERYDAASKTTRWILIQPSRDFRAQMLEYMNSKSGRPNPLELHVLLLLSSATHWRGYINDLEKQLKKMEDKALFSRVETFTPNDYELTFSDVQTIQKLRKKLLKLQTILEASLDIAAGLKEHAMEIRTVGIDSSPVDASVLGRVGIYIAQLRSHCRTASMLLEHLEGISKVLFQILQRRNDNALVKNNRTMANATTAMLTSNQGIRNNGLVMRRLTLVSQEENKALNRLTKKSQQDSHFVKILTFLALLYLPASLIAAVFSSNLVERGGRGGFALATQFWIFPVLTLALTVVTILAAFLWYRIYQKKDSAQNQSPEDSHGCQLQDMSTAEQRNAQAWYC